MRLEILTDFLFLNVNLTLSKNFKVIRIGKIGVKDRGYVVEQFPKLF